MLTSEESDFSSCWRFSVGLAQTRGIQFLSVYFPSVSFLEKQSIKQVERG